MNGEEILLRLGLDASKERQATLAMLDRQKKASMEYVSFWRKALQEREQLEVQADQKAAIRSNRARALMRQRHTERVSQWKKELEAQRGVTGISKEAANIKGVALSNLRRNMVGGAEQSLGAGLFSNPIAMREFVTVLREAGRGNFSRIPGSISIIIQSFGKLGTALGLLINPITATIAGLAAGVGFVYKLGYNAQQVIRQSRDAGLSVGTYQTFLRQAGRESGGREAAQGALGTLAENIGQLREGDMGQLRKFRKYGIDTSGSNEQIFQRVLGRYEGMTDPAKRAALAMDMFGEGWKKIIKTLDEGNAGMQAAMGKGVMTAGQLGVLSTLGSQIGDTTFGAWSMLKQSIGGAMNAVKQGYVKYATTVNPGLGLIEQESQRSEDLEKRRQELIASGKIKGHMNQAIFERLHPELAAGLKEATMRQEDIMAERNERGEMGVTELAAMGRRMSGHIRPRVYTVTPLMRAAMKIDDLEARSQMAWLRGDRAGQIRYRQQADALRGANPLLMLKDREPLRKTEEQLVEANKTLKDMKDIAKQITSEY